LGAPGADAAPLRDGAPERFANRRGGVFDVATGLPHRDRRGGERGPFLYWMCLMV
jgi:hypothetical protein